MNLPIIIDIAIGLVFIYLILSLLASEIQELIATFLQWRAKHLKESVEILIGGAITRDSKRLKEASEEIQKTRALANQIYKSPLIKTLNFENTGFIAGIMRRSFGWLDTIFRAIDKWWKGETEDIFGGENSAPSYIPPDTFSTSMIETLKINEVVRSINSDRVIGFKQDLITKINKAWEYIADADPHISEAAYYYFNERDSYDQVISKQRLLDVIEITTTNFEQDHTDLLTTIDAINQEIDRYINQAQSFYADSPESSSLNNFIHQLELAKDKLYIADIGGNKRATILGSNRTTIAQVIQAYKEIKYSGENPDDLVHQKIKEISGDIVHQIPSQLMDSLVAIAKETKVTVDDIEDELQYYRNSLATWFDRSMDRASGVYRRNSKGVAFLLGVMIAIVANADTFNIVNRLAVDQTLRDSLTNLSANLETIEDVKAASESLNKNLEAQGLAIPIGWSDKTLVSQAQIRKQMLLPFCNEKFKNVPLKDTPLVCVLPGWGTQVFGWLISGIAISMGAPFWFDLLGKVVNVRNTGKKGKPEDSSKQ